MVLLALHKCCHVVWLGRCCFSAYLLKVCLEAVQQLGSLLHDGQVSTK
jgi:hypothetical protein